MNTRTTRYEHEDILDGRRGLWSRDGKPRHNKMG